MDPEGLELDPEEMAIFARDAETRSGEVGNVVDSIAAVHLNNSVLGFFGSWFVEDAQGSLTAIVADARTTVEALAVDADIANAVVADTADAEQAAADNLTRTEFP
jgi:myo-inositol-hexaphosphate 3-phosphohydrolase